MNHKNLRRDETIGEPASTACPDRAAWLQDNAPVMNIWGETSPVLPNEAKWDALWTNLSAQLDQAELAAPEEVANTFSMRRLIAGRRRKLALTGFVLAQAAVIMLVVSLGLREKDKGAVPVPASTLGDVVVEAGGTTLIQNDGASVKTVVLAFGDRQVDTNLDLLNSMEAMAAN